MAALDYMTYAAMALQLNTTPNVCRYQCQKRGFRKPEKHDDSYKEQIREMLDQGYPTAHIIEVLNCAKDTVYRIGNPKKTDRHPPSPPLPCKTHGTERYWVNHASGWRACCDRCHENSYGKATKRIKLGRNISETEIARLFKGRRFRDRLARRQRVPITS